MFVTISLVSEAPTCIVRFVEACFPADSIKETMNIEASNDMPV